MARWIAVAVAAAVVALGGGAAGTVGAPVLGEKVNRPMLGLVYGPTSSTLVRIDAELRALEGRGLDVGHDTVAWSFSADRTRLALGGDRGRKYKIAEVLIVDTQRLRALGRVKLVPWGSVVATAWLPGGRLCALVTTDSVILVTVDTVRREVVARHLVAGRLVDVAQARDSLVLLLAPAAAIGPARLAVVRPSGSVDVALLGRVQAGIRVTGRAEARGNKPALAVDPDGDRAYVMPADGEVAEVDLARLHVSYHALSHRISLLGRLARWLEPEAQAKVVRGAGSARALARERADRGFRRRLLG
jgi:hypothetical protein